MTVPSFLAIVEFTTAAADRAAAIAQLEREQPVVAAMPGCCAFRVLRGAGDGAGVTVLHEWSDREAFEAYLASAAFARSGVVLRPLMTAPPISRRFHVELLESVA